MNSALKAKDRLRRLGFSEWLGRVEMLLSLDGYQVTDFPDLYWEGYFKAGVSAGRVAEVVLGVMRQVKRMGVKV